MSNLHIVKFTKNNGCPIYVFVPHIVGFTRSEGEGTTIIPVTGFAIQVRESVAEVLKQVQSVQGV